MAGGSTLTSLSRSEGRATRSVGIACDCERLVAQQGTKNELVYTSIRPPQPAENNQNRHQCPGRVTCGARARRGAAESEEASKGREEEEGGKTRRTIFGMLSLMRNTCSHCGQTISPSATTICANSSVRFLRQYGTSA